MRIFGNIKKLILRKPLNNDVFFILTDAYLSPKYFEILYPDEKNLLLEKLDKKLFYKI